MESNNANEVAMLGTSEEIRETTVEIKIKTLDSQTYTLRVNRSVPVPALKEQIANVTGILSEQQRLICQGKVLKDDQLLSAYNVEDGHTLHLVSRQPPSASTSSLETEDVLGHTGTNPTLRTIHRQNNPLGNNVVFGAVNLSDQGEPVTSELSQGIKPLESWELTPGRSGSGRGGCFGVSAHTSYISDVNNYYLASTVTSLVFSTLISSFGFTSFGMDGERQDIREGISDRSERTSGSGVSDSAQSETNQSAVRAEVHQGDVRFPSTHSLGQQQHPPVIPDSLTTLFQYLSHMRHEFDANGGEHRNSAETGNIQYGGWQRDDSRLQLHLDQGGLPTPACLAEVLISARQLLMEQAGGCLHELARQLENQASVTDPLVRTNIQSSAVRYGAIFQNLGSLLLELGRTLTTLRLGQTPLEAVVNAGPAIFISSSAPNPLMVQAGTNFGGIPMGTLHSDRGLGGGPVSSGFLSGNIDIRIRRGHSVPTVTTSVGGQASVQQPSGRTNTLRSSGENVTHQVFQSGSVNASVPREPGMRVVPLRTVVAVHDGVSHPPPDSSGSAVGVFYPLLARFQQHNPGSSNDVRVSQASLGSYSIGTGTTHQQDSDSLGRGNGMTVPAAESAQQGASGVSIPSGLEQLNINNSDGASAHEEQQSGQDSIAQMFSRFGEMVRGVFPGEQVQVSDISIQGTATDSAAGQTGTITDAEGQTASQGQVFSGLLHQLMPFISQSMTDPSSSSEQPVSHSTVDSGTSAQHCRDPPEAPDSKRLKRE